MVTWFHYPLYCRGTNVVPAKGETSIQKGHRGELETQTSLLKFHSRTPFDFSFASRFYTQLSGFINQLPPSNTHIQLHKELKAKLN